MAHTISGGVIADVRCNGRSIGELGLNTALAAHSGVPAVLAAGDDSVAAEAADVAPGMRSVVVKHALGARAAALLHPDEACDRIEQEVPKALADRGLVKPLRFDGPVALEVEVPRTRMTHTRSASSSRCSVPSDSGTRAVPPAAARSSPGYEQQSSSASP
jgi:D-amino peptidase